MHDHHGPSNYNRAFAAGVALNVLYILVEAGAGLYVNSLALLADAGHNLSDVLGLLLAWGAHILSQVKPTNRRTYGLRGSSILAALANGLMLMLVTGGIIWESVQRFGNPTPVAGSVVIWVAAVGVLINSITALFFLRGSRHDLNIRGAYLHMAADAAVSLGEVIAGIVISVWGWLWVDPVVSLIVAAVIFAGTWGLFRESLELLLHAVPRGIDLTEVQQMLENLPGVEVVHDLHVWAMSTTQVALTAHLVRDTTDIDDQFLHQLSKGLQNRFKIIHPTIQIESGQQAHLCGQAHHESV